jgi:hypothetical protein
MHTVAARASEFSHDSRATLGLRPEHLSVQLTGGDF